MSNIFIEVVEDGVLTENTTAQFYVATFTASADTFTELFDTPSTKVGAAGKLIQISDDESKLVYVNVQNGLKSTEGVIELDIDGLPETETHDPNMRIPVSDGTIQQSIPISGLATTLEAYGASQSDFEAIRAQNNEQFAASGFVHFGKGSTSYGGAVNEGLWALTSTANILMLGVKSDFAGAQSASKTDFPICNIAGVVSSIMQVNNPTESRNDIKFPEAPDGTVTYDSATGAIVQHSSAAEAFDYETTNSNFRDGTTGWNTATVSVSNSLATIVGTNARVQTVGAQFELIVGEQYIVDIYITEVRGGSIRYTTDALAHQALIANKVGLNTAIFTATATNYFFWCVDTDLDVSYISVRKATEEVVTDRVDMWGFESFLEEVNSAKPVVYDRGLIQSQATTISGIPTVVDSSRPTTYFAVFDGDTSSRGRGLDFFATSTANRKKLLSDPKHKFVFMPNIGLVQWRLRQRTIAGAGNGDWGVIESTTSFTLGFESNKARLHTQGAKDAPSGVFGNQIADVFANNPSWGSKSGSFYTGVFAPRNISTNDGIGVNGECYFLVCGTVNRLNQGAYHPSFNPSGVSWVITNNGANGGAWYRYPEILTTKSDCFDYYNQVTNPTGKASSPEKGAIGGGQYGRPDGRAHDAIYAEGQGGVCRDMRYSANGVDLVDFDEADLRAKSGTYRGFEKLRLTKVLPAVSHTATAYQPSGTLVYVEGLLDFIGANFSGGFRKDIYVSSDNATDWYQVFAVSSDASGEFVYIDHAYGDLTSEFPIGSHILVSKDLNTSVGGSFLQTDVIGDPANILQIDALKYGWEGSWVPVIPNSAAKHPLTRKALSTSETYSFTSDNGASWSSNTATSTISTVTNERNAVASGGILISQYQAFAKQTEPADNAVVYGGYNGIGRVWASDWHAPTYGATFVESLIGKIPKSPSSIYGLLVSQSLGVMDAGVLGGGKIDMAPYGYPMHVGLRGTLPPQNSTPAAKALDYNVNVTHQAFKQYAATELKHDGTDWGDDSMVTVVNGESTKTDLNDNTVKVVTHKLKEPIGWIKNKV